ISTSTKWLGAKSHFARGWPTCLSRRSCACSMRCANALLSFVKQLIANQMLSTKNQLNTEREKTRPMGNLAVDQLASVEKMRDYISASGSVEREHLEANNVLGPIHKAFGEKLWPLMDELNLTLAA